MGICWAAALFALGAAAQSLDIVSEFQRPDPFGKIVAADRALRPREILSPGLAANGFASFHLVVSAPRNYLLYVDTNPTNAARVALYREHFVKTAAGWIPDTLVPVQRLPDFGVIPDPDQNIPGQTTRVYLLDLWIPPDARPPGFRLEVQLKTGDWTVRPLEVRVIPVRIPDLKPGGWFQLPAVERGLDIAAIDALWDPGFAEQPLTVRGIVRRNAMQDMALARAIGSRRTGAEALQRLWKTVAAQPDLGAERYLRIRSLIYAEALCAW